MKERISIHIVIAAMAALLTAGIISAGAQTYNGRATAVKATVYTGLLPGITSAVSDTGPLPSAGGTVNLASASTSIPNIWQVRPLRYRILLR